MKSLSLNAKFILVVAILIAAGGVTGWFGVSRLSLLNEQVTEIVKVNVPRIRVANQLRDFLRQIAVEERNVIMEDDSSERTALLKEMESIKSELDKRWDHANEIASVQGKEKLNAFKEAEGHYWTFVQQSLAAASKNDTKTATEIALKKGTPARREATKQINEILQFNQVTLDKIEKETDELYDRSRNIMLIVILLASIGGIAITFVVLRALSIAIDKVISTLASASDQVAQSSEQIASASEQLSQSSNEQAASLQETTSSLEELTSMVAKNTENAKSTADTTQQALQAAEGGKETIQSMVGAIQELEQSNQQIAEIVKVFTEIQEKTKVIEDIVFQTQLLSFNASVEAARAGEHGKGFAVVAEEVGNLAEMSGNASGEITGLLDSSLKKVETTVEDLKTKITRLVEQGGKGIDAMNQIVEGANTASAKVGEISVASNEQSRGIQEINRAMGQLDQATQQNAATSEEAASSAEELSGQAISLRNTVQDLVFVIKGGNSGTTSNLSMGPTTPSKASTSQGALKKKGNVVPFRGRQAKKPASEGTESTPLKKAAGAENFPSSDDPGFVDL